MNQRSALPVTIVLAEDYTDDQMFVKEALAESRFANAVNVVQDGRELLDYLQRLGDYEEPAEAPRPALILLDLKMPRLDGRAALRELRSRPETRHVPVVVVSSSDQQSDVRECYELGANSFVVKQMNPWSPGTYLVDTVRYWLDMNEVPS
jgi:CheY-like chemotaxis protein